MSNIYNITLQPLDWFFFGGETTLQNSKESDGKQIEKYVYLVRSNSLPQQTTILGMLRYQLLKQKGLLNSNDKDKISELIGTESFSMRENNQDFGVIENISPVFIRVGDVNYFPMPLTDNYNCQFEENGITVGYNGDTKKGMVFCKDYNEKTYSNYCLWKGSNKSSLSIDDIIERRFKVGISKPRDGGDPEEEAYFKMQMCRFKKENTFFSFYAQLDIDDDTQKQLNNNKVFIGAERSCFIMNIISINETDIFQAYLNAMDKAKPSPMENSIILLSPTYIEDVDELNKNVIFHWSFPMPFRNIEQILPNNNIHSTSQQIDAPPSTVKEHHKSDGNFISRLFGSNKKQNQASSQTTTTVKKESKTEDNYKILDSGTVKYKRYPQKYNMFCAGSHLFCTSEGMSEVIKLLKKTNCKKIGYNYYITSQNNNK